MHLYQRKKKKQDLMPWEGELELNDDKPQTKSKQQCPHNILCNVFLGYLEGCIGKYMQSNLCFVPFKAFLIFL